ncbi:MAG: hypothetical protein BMS9Abin31_0137 [Gammaproteobacteria bacterium]|nr:MAG: hypothetical protein BMS9Abin31_0137 [Gammaproteobacteria bacterium]
MKAYMIFSGYPQDGCLLVFAESRNKAKYAVSISGYFDWDYENMNSRRMKPYDKYYKGRSMVDCNDDLPKNAPSFYSDHDL